LRDGLPLFGSFANVIGVTQIPPLDIAQIEIIKGSAFTLYGGDAIGGVINMVTKKPTEKPVYDLMLNGESALAADAGFYGAQQFGKVGFSVYGIYRYQKEKDWNGESFTETPLLQRYAFAPQLYFDITEKINLTFGISYLHEVRTGGAINAVRKEVDSTQTFYERNKSEQGASNLRLTIDLDKKGMLTIKNTQNLFIRNLSLSFFQFSGTQFASNTEINYNLKFKKHALVIGIDVRYDRFIDNTKDSTAQDLSYSFLTIGSFLQYTYSPTDRTHLEAGFRLDYNRP
jgi:iron complex outermembrane receptor protein